MKGPCKLPPIADLLSPTDAEIFQKQHNAMPCEVITEDIFLLLNQPIMFTNSMTLNEFDDVMKDVVPQEEKCNIRSDVTPPLTRSKDLALQEAKENGKENESKLLVCTFNVICSF